MKTNARPSDPPVDVQRKETAAGGTGSTRQSLKLIDGRYFTEFEKALATDTDVKAVLEYVHERIGGPLLRQIRVLQRAAHIASACEHYAQNGRTSL